MVEWIISCRRSTANNQRNSPHYIPAQSHPQIEIVTKGYSQEVEGETLKRPFVNIKKIIKSLKIKAIV